MVQIRPEDIDEVFELHSIWERYWRVPIATTREELVEQRLTSRRMVARRDIRGVRSRDNLVAVGTVKALATTDTLAPVDLWGIVHPDHLGQGLGRELLQWQVEHGTSLLKDISTTIERILRVDEFDWIEDAHRLYKRFGFEEARRFQEMTRALDVPVPQTPDPPDVDIVTWDPIRNAEVGLVADTAFADHWGSTPRTPEEWHSRLDRSHTRLDLSWLAIADQVVIGYLLTDHHPADEAVTGTRDSWIGSLGVLRPWRGRGVATSLIQHALGSYRQAGFTHAKLGVDASNPTGAVHVYQSIGFEVSVESITHLLTVVHT